MAGMNSLSYDPPYQGGFGAAKIKREGTVHVSEALWKELVMYLAEAHAAMVSNGIEPPKLNKKLARERDRLMFRVLKGGDEE